MFGRSLMLFALVGCGSKPPAAAPSDPMAPADSKMMAGMGMAADGSSTFGPLEVGADWQSYAKLNKAPYESETHGGRMVDTYVNSVGLDAFKAGTELPVGSIVVKTSVDKKTGGAGPTFVMEKRAPGFAPDQADWWYAIHWAEPPEAWKQKLGGPIYWRTPSSKAAYCVECHENFDHQIGGVPDEQKSY